MLKNSNYREAEINQSEKTDLLDNIDFIKMMEVFRKNIIWIILIMMVSITGAYLFIRYTKAVYVSASEL